MPEREQSEDERSSQERKEIERREKRHEWKLRETTSDCHGLGIENGLISHLLLHREMHQHHHPPRIILQLYVCIEYQNEKKERMIRKHRTGKRIHVLDNTFFISTVTFSYWVLSATASILSIFGSYFSHNQSVLIPDAHKDRCSTDWVNSSTIIAFRTPIRHRAEILTDYVEQ